MCGEASSSARLSSSICRRISETSSVHSRAPACASCRCTYATSSSACAVPRVLGRAQSRSKTRRLMSASVLDDRDGGALAAWPLAAGTSRRSPPIAALSLMVLDDERVVVVAVVVAAFVIVTFAASSEASDDVSSITLIVEADDDDAHTSDADETGGVTTNSRASGYGHANCACSFMRISENWPALAVNALLGRRKNATRSKLR